MILRLLETRLRRSDREIAKDVGASYQYVRLISPKWRHLLLVLINECSIIGITAKDLHNMATLGASLSTWNRVESHLRTLDDKNDTPVEMALYPAEYQRVVDSLWREYRDNASYKGRSPDSLPIRAPRWFLVNELGIKEGTVLEIVGRSGFVV